MSVLPSDIEIYKGADRIIDAFLSDLPESVTVVSGKLALKRLETDDDSDQESVVIEVTDTPSANGEILDDGETSQKGQIRFVLLASDIADVPYGSRFYGATATLSNGQTVALAGCRGVAIVKSAGPTG